MSTAQSSAALSTELLAPVVPASDDERSLTIAQAAKMIGVSPATLHRRIVDGEVPAERDGRIWRVSQKTVLEVGPLRKRDAPRSREDRARDAGALAARVFPLLRAATPIEDIVEALAADPATVRALVAEYVQCRELSVRLLTAAPDGPVFDHADTGSCCPGHEALRKTERR